MIYDIFYTSKKEINDNDWQQFRSRFPSAQKIENVASFEDIRNKAFTRFFWIVWDDLVVENTFNFDHRVSKWDESYIHLWLNGDSYDGIGLFSKETKITQKEFNHRFYINKKEFNVVASRPKKYEVFKIGNYDDYIRALDTSSTDMFWAIWNNTEIINEQIFKIYFSHHNSYDRNENHVFKNLCMTTESFVSGPVLFSKNKPASKKEIDHRFLINKKEYDSVASRYRYNRYTIKNYEDYLKIIAQEQQPLFWCVWEDVEVNNTDIFDLYYDPFNGEYDFDRSINHIFKNKVVEEESYVSGIVLFTTEKPVSKKEFDHRFFIDKKEHNIVCSQTIPFDRFEIESYQDYLSACEKTRTELFWIIPNEIQPLEDFDFNSLFSHNSSERKFNHVFLNRDVSEIKYSGLMLVSKNIPVTAKEIDHRYLIDKKEHDIVASELKPYDIIFISYNEPNADYNYDKLISRFPRAKRVHGVKGIHNAHREAAKLSTTPMFYVVDGDADIIDEFKFDLLLHKWDRDIVHIWHSRNPINGLEYGYGGVKLLPKQAVLDMNMNSVDMTTSISEKIRIMKEVSNYTAFNTDPFNTWKSAFREVCKLVSKSIDRNYQEETDDRIDIWCIVGKNMPYGEYAISGARAGKKFGIDNLDNPDQLRKINDFDWLYQQFELENANRT